MKCSYYDHSIQAGNGIDPKYLAGREDLLSSFQRSLESCEEGLPRDMVLSGLRGTGKTVLLRRFKVLSESRKWVAVEREFNERFQDENEFASFWQGGLADSGRLGNQYSNHSPSKTQYMLSLEEEFVIIG